MITVRFLHDLYCNIQMPPKRSRVDSGSSHDPATEDECRLTIGVLRSDRMGWLADIADQHVQRFRQARFNDKFLPVWTETTLRNRAGLSPDEAQAFMTEVETLRTTGSLPVISLGTSTDVDSIVKQLLPPQAEHGCMQRAIDDYLRDHNVICTASTVSKARKAQAAVPPQIAPPPSRSASPAPLPDADSEPGLKQLAVIVHEWADSARDSVVQMHRVLEDLRALVEAVKAPDIGANWWVQGGQGTVGKCLSLHLHPEAPCDANQAFQPHSLVTRSDGTHALVAQTLPPSDPDARRSWYANDGCVVKVTRVGPTQGLSRAESIQDIAFACIDASATDRVCREMQWEGGSFGLVCNATAYVCVHRPRFQSIPYSISSQQIVEFLFGVAAKTGVWHNDWHKHNVMWHKGMLVAFDFERATQFVTGHHPSKDDAIKYADAIHNQDKGSAISMLKTLQQRGLDAVVRFFEGQWSDNAAAFGKAFDGSMFMQSPPGTW